MGIAFKTGSVIVCASATGDVKEGPRSALAVIGAAFLIGVPRPEPHCALRIVVQRRYLCGDFAGHSGCNFKGFGGAGRITIAPADSRTSIDISRFRGQYGNDPGIMTAAIGFYRRPHQFYTDKDRFNSHLVRLSFLAMARRNFHRVTQKVATSSVHVGCLRKRDSSSSANR